MQFSSCGAIALPANAKLIRTLRLSMQWTQLELAKKSGYTERLIRKVESGGNVAESTLQDIGDAFRDAGIELNQSDLNFDPKQLARRFIESMYRDRSRVIDQCRDFLHEDVVVIFSGDMEHIPFAGRHEGIDAARKAFEIFFSILEPPEDLSELSHWEYLATDRGALAWGDSWIHPIGRPMNEPVRTAVRYEFQRGKLKLWEDRFDTQAGALVIQEAQLEKSERVKLGHRTESSPTEGH
ncbi:MAG: helix-turn-helix transcriptional regulator [Planctomycetota bacterium]